METLRECPGCGPDGRPVTFSRFSSDEGETTPVQCARCKFEAPSIAAWNTRPADAWRPMEEAPKDGTWTLVVYAGKNGYRTLARWVKF